MSLNGNVSEKNVIVGKVVYLGTNDSADNWHEITDAQAQALQGIETEE